MIEPGKETTIWEGAFVRTTYEFPSGVKVEVEIDRTSLVAAMHITDGDTKTCMEWIELDGFMANPREL